MKNGTVRPVKVKPAIYQFGGVPWGWVSVPELAEMVYGRESADGTLWIRFAALSKDAPLLAMVFGGEDSHKSRRLPKGVVHVWAEVVEKYDYDLGGTVPRSMLKADSGQGDPFEMDPYLDLRSAFVPAGFALAVLEAVAKGIVRVVPVDHRHLSDKDECPPGTLDCQFNGGPDPDFAFTAAVGLDADDKPVVH